MIIPHKEMKERERQKNSNRSEIKEVTMYTMEIIKGHY